VAGTDGIAMTGQVQDASPDRPASARFDVFVSFADEDRDWVEGFLLPAFDDAGVRYGSEADFVPGEPLADQFVAAVEGSERVLLVISPAFLADDSARRLSLLAQQFGQERSTWPVLPVLLHPVEKLPLSLSMLARLDATRESEWDHVVARLLRELERELGDGHEPPECPYPGMAPYDRDRSGSFHGRDAEIDEVLRRLRLHPLLLVVGPSGSGKSSLLHAGVEPRLIAARYRVIGIRPGPTPLDELDAALDRAGTDDRMTVLVVDQLEELFTVAAAPPGTASQVDAFCAELARLRSTGQVQCLLAVRADYYPQLMTSPLWDDVRDHRLEVLPLAGDRLREAIAAPAAQVNVHIESALLHAIVHDAAGQPGSLPLIQETLVLLWRDLRRRYLPLSAYDGLVLPSSAYGEPPRTGLQVALAHRADAAMAELATDQDRLIARRIFLRLVQLMDGRDDVRRRQRRRELESADDPAGAFDRVLAHLMDARLITCTTDEKTADTGAALIDLAHEAIITGWPALRSWIAERRAAEDARRRLEHAAREWAELGSGEGGLLDDIEVRRAQTWLDSPDAVELGHSAELPALVAASRSALEAARTRKARLDRLFRLLSAALAVLLAAVVGVAVLAVQERNRAEEGQQLARSGELALAAKSILPYGLDRALLLAREASAIRDTPLTRDGLLAALSSNPRVLRTLHAAADQRAVQVFRDGTWALTGGRDGVVRRWDLRSGVSERIGAVNGEVRAVVLVADGSVVAVTSSEGDVGQWDLTSGQRVLWPEQPPELAHEGSVRAAAYSPDGRWLVTGGEDGRVILRDAASGGESRVFTEHRDWVNDAVFSPDGSLLVTAGGHTEGRSTDQRILVRDVGTGNVLAELHGHTDAVRALAINRDGALLASAGADGLVKVWSLPDGEFGRDLVGHSGRVFDVAFAPDGTRLATAGRDQTVRIWDAATGESVGEPLVGHADAVRSVAFAGQDRLLSVGNGTRLFLWDAGELPVSRLATSLPDQLTMSRALAVDANGDLLATGDDAGSVVVRNTSDGSPVRVLELGEPVSGLGFGPDATLVTATFSGVLQVFDAATGEERSAVDTGEEGLVVAVSPDGDLVATGGHGGDVRLWDPELQPLDPLGRHEGWVHDLVFRPSDGSLVSVGSDGQAFLWPDLSSGEGIRLTEQAQTSFLLSADISPDGRLLATGNVDGQLALWELTGSGSEQTDRPAQGGHDGSVTGVAFDPAGRRLITSDAGGTLRLWEAGPALEPLGVLGRLPALEDVVGVPGRDVLFTVGGSGVARWTLGVDDWRAMVCDVAGRNLDPVEAERYGFDRAPQTCPDAPGD
jgi:WD40 repeat protein